MVVDTAHVRNIAVAKCSVVFGVLALVSLIPVLVYQTQVMQNKREGKTKEW